MGVIGKLSGLFRAGRKDDKETHPALAEVIRLVDPRLAELDGRLSRLSEAIDHASRYFAAQVDTIPGPIPVSHAHHAEDPRLRTLFASAADIQSALGCSIEVRDALARLAESGKTEVHGLLGVRSRKNTPDSGSHAYGQSQPAYADHTFRSLGPDEHDARRLLSDAALTSLVKAFATRLGDERRKLKLLKSELALNKQADKSTGLALAPGSTRRQHDPVLDEYFARTARELTPEGTLDGLVHWLQTPEVQMRVQTVIGDEAVTIPTQTTPLALPLLASNDRRQWLVCFARFRIDEAAIAIGKETRSHRYIMI